MHSRRLAISSAAGWLGGLLLGGSSLSCHSPRATGKSESEVAGSGGGSELAGSGGRSEVASGGASAGGNAPRSACRAEPELTPSVPAVTALDPDLVARAAAVIGSCIPDDGVARNATHLWLSHLAAARTYYRLVGQLTCLANADCGCAAAEHCLGWVYQQAPAGCSSQCQGDVFTGCDDDFQLSVDCSRLGLSCDPTAFCVPEATVACAGSDPTTCTAQGEVKYCNDGAWRKTPCQALGFKCVAGKCVGEGASCSGEIGDAELVHPLGTGCAGNTLHGCLGGQATSVDCATQGPGFSCQAHDGSFFCGLASECVPADNYAAPASVATTCTGTTLSFCNAGRLEHLDCTELGFTGCEIDRTLDHYGCTPGGVAQ